MDRQGKKKGTSFIDPLFVVFGRTDTIRAMHRKDNHFDRYMDSNAFALSYILSIQPINCQEGGSVEPRTHGPVSPLLRVATERIGLKIAVSLEPADNRSDCRAANDIEGRRSRRQAKFDNNFGLL